MSERALVFYDPETDIEELIQKYGGNASSLDLEEVVIDEAGVAKEGEIWSPQLLPYEEWGATQGERQEDEVAADLFSVGSLTLGIDKNYLDSILAKAVKDNPLAASESSVVVQKKEYDEDVDLQGAFAVREAYNGYILVGADLRRFAASLGQKEDLVVVLPAYIDGKPVVRVSPEAFARRHVQGVGIRLLVIPDTVENVGEDTFATISVGHVHLGAGVSRLGGQSCDLAGVSPRLGCRNYTVSEENTHYKGVDGNLLTKNGARLMFLAPPYGERVYIPEVVTQIDASALCRGCGKPQLVYCPTSLERVSTKEWDDCVWICPETARARKPLEDRGVRLAGPNAVRYEDCWYDFDENGAVLIAGPPAPRNVSQRFADAAAARYAGRSDQSPFDLIWDVENRVPDLSGRTSLILPREVDGKPLTRIAVRALPFAPATLVLPDTVRVVERDNACRGTKRLVLPEGIEVIGSCSFRPRTFEGIVPIPKSVKSIGYGCFEYSLCRLEHTGSIVHVSADQMQSCFLEEVGEDGVPFSYEQYDEVIFGARKLPDMLGTYIHRLADPIAPPEKIRENLLERLRSRLREAQERVAKDGDLATVQALFKAGFINDETFDRQIELLRSCNRTDCVLYLMDQRGGEKAEEKKPASARSRFAL